MAKKRKHTDLSTPRRTDLSAPKEGPARPSRLLTLTAILALFFVVAGARWWVVRTYGSDVPWLDQWDAEARGLYLPWQNGTLSLASWFAPHNEHRILFTRLLAFFLYLANGQWDPRLEMVVNAGLAAGVACLMFLFLYREETARMRTVLWLLLAIVFSLPYGSTNILLGFQSVFYFLTGFSLLCLYAMVNFRAGAPAWIAGVLCGAAALVSMASGNAASLAVLVVLFLSLARNRIVWRRELRKIVVTATAAVLLVGTGFLIKYSPEQHAQLGAHSVGDFGKFLLGCLSWPARPMILFAGLFWLPFGLFVARYVRGKAGDGRRDRFLLGVGAWVLLQAVALSLYRANSGEGLESRYLEILAFGLVVNVVCGFELVRGGKVWFVPFLFAFLSLAGVSLWNVSFNGNSFAWKQAMEFRRAEVAGFTATEDPRFMTSRWLPYYNPKALAEYLLDPAMARTLPAGVRRPLRLVPGAGSPEPQYVNDQSMPNPAVMVADVWNWSGIYLRFASVPGGSDFEYRVAKNSDLPYLLLWMQGDGEVRVVDGNGAAHGIRTLPSGPDRKTRHAVVACPTKECLIKGKASASLLIAEPREMGWLSVLALEAVLWSWLVFAIGVALFLIASAFSFLPRSSRA